MYSLQIDFLKPFRNTFEDIVETLPTVAGFVGFIIVSWLLIKVFLYIVRKALAKTKIDEWSKKLSKTEIFGNSTINIVLTNVILAVLKWFLIFMFVMVGAEMFGLSAVSEGIKSFFAYLPKLLTALGIFVAGAYLGTMVKKAIHTMFKSLEISGGNLVGNIAFYLIVIFLSITALDQAGVDTSVIKSNLLMLIGSILLAFTIAFGLGARDAVSRLLFGYYSRKNIGIGEKIIINDIEGVVVAIDNICLTVATGDGKVVIPIKDVVDSKIVVRK
ncbi:small-conductance mechanosensitive channel [Tenacibaculum sp. S7007]|uniref:Small-conductance mechanosensitive channel n=1 Tax=Tenacibaculum pelagium TaxID=2759527 RepID=A0A839AN76_9FLAO|nr:small-conductance mechanosensitive channel [Tenacibaculum pelagium]MBA6155947.1 small-conductance mechanosensitive channel [Tenacibaculum pelagium]